MKKLAYIFVISTILSCQKKTNTPNSQTPFKASKPNTVTLTTGGQTHTVNEGISIQEDGSVANTFVDCYIAKTSTDSKITLYIQGPSLPFTMNFLSLKGPVSGVGVHKFKNGGTLEEKFPGGLTYDIDSGVVDIASLSTTIAGSFKFYLSNTAGNKVVDGTLDIKKPIY
jgi:hypothetical protein